MSLSYCSRGFLLFSLLLLHSLFFFFRNFAADLPLCPCTLEQAVYDKGRYRPDRDCDKDSNPTCLRHKTAIHCVVSGTPT